MKKVLLIIFLVILTCWLTVLTYFYTKQQEGTKQQQEEIQTEVSEYEINGITSDMSEAIVKNKTSIVAIEQGSKVSTGFIYETKDDNVYVVTTLHGIDGKEEEIDVYLRNGAKLVGNIKAKDVYLDLALIECVCPYEVKKLSLYDSKTLKDGEFVISIGTCSSLEYDFSSQFGMVSSKYREVNNNISYENANYDYYLGMIQLSGEFKQGYSGAPVFNLLGQTVGIINSKDGDVVLASTTNEVKIVLEKMMNEEEYNRFNFGIKGRYISELESYEKTCLNIGLDVIKGYYVEEVGLSSFAANIGLLKGDVIKSINGIDIVDLDSMLSVIYSNAEEYQFVIIRNFEEIEISGLIDA